jgi:tRNA 2-thiouridine synthesizing protein E
MSIFEFNGKSYRLDAQDFLVNPVEWDEDFARGMAPKVGIITGLREDHWNVIRFIRDSYNKTGECPLAYESCRVNRLHIQELNRLFPSGYLRGACKLAGITLRRIFQSILV